MTGGSTSGTIGFPTYMQTYHSEILGNPASLTGGNLVSISNAMLASPTPYDGVVAADPASDLAAMATAVSALLSAINALDLESAYTAEVAGAISMLDNQSNFPKADVTTNIAATAISNAVSKANEVANTALAGVGVTIELEAKSTLYDQIGRLLAGTVELNSANSSAFMIGLAMLESQYLNVVGTAKSKLRLDAFSNVVNTLINADVDIAKEQLQYRRNMIDKIGSLGAQAAATRLQIMSDYTAKVIESKRMAIVARSEQIAQNTDFDVRESLWDIEILMRMVQAVGGLGTGTLVPPSTSKSQSAIGGALSAAGTAAALTGNPYAIVGAGLIGGIAGLL